MLCRVATVAFRASCAAASSWVSSSMMRRHPDRHPFLAGPLPTTRQRLGPTAPAVRVRRGGQDVAVGVAGAGIDGIREDVVDDRVGPHAPPASRPPRPVGQAADDRPDRQLVIDQPAVHHPHHGRLGVVDDQVAGHVVPLGDVAVAVRGPAGDPCPGPRPLDLTPAEPLPEDGPLVLSYGPLDLQEELVVRVGGDRALHEFDATAGLAKLLEQEHLIGVAACQAVGAVDGDDIELRRGRRIPEPVKSGAVESSPGVAGVGEDVFGAKVMSLLGDPLPKGRKLTVDRLVAFLLLGRDSCVDRYSHGRAPLVGQRKRTAESVREGTGWPSRPAVCRRVSGRRRNGLSTPLPSSRGAGSSKCPPRGRA